MAYDSAALGSPVHVNWKDAKAKSPREQGKQLPSVSLPPTLPTALVSSSLPLLFSSDPHIISFPPAPYSWRDKWIDREKKKIQAAAYWLWTSAGQKWLRHNLCLSFSQIQNHAKAKWLRRRKHGSHGLAVWKKTPPAVETELIGRQITHRLGKSLNHIFCHRKKLVPRLTSAFCRDDNK